MNNTILSGQCICGAIQYELTSETIGVVNCHCKMCQRLHGNRYTIPFVKE
jgi:hypothetical protein